MRDLCSRLVGGSYKKYDDSKVYNGSILFHIYSLKASNNFHHLTFYAST